VMLDMPVPVLFTTNSNSPNSAEATHLPGIGRVGIGEVIGVVVGIGVSEGAGVVVGIGVSGGAVTYLVLKVQGLFLSTSAYD
jgi:hypothetical protein